ncbi:alpha/beta fold hydrolase [Streptomyces sp. NPDC048595]|uniref:alpha/beta fold hydrolase n=1 Tax=Streptomyces sp. NPDC048595 TaxID=3365576 RepID=UPI003723C831
MRHRPATAARWRQERTVHADGTELAVWERHEDPDAGAAPAPHVVLVHGFEEGWESWQPLLEHLPRTVRASALSLPWRAGSAHTWPRHGDAATWLARAFDVLERPPDLFVAHSFGACALLQLLARHPAHPYRDVPAALVAPVWRVGDRSLTPEFFAEARTRFRHTITEGLQVQLHTRGRTVSGELLRIMADKVLERVEPEGFLQFYLELARLPHLPVDRITAPLLVVSGLDDTAAPGGDLEVLRRRARDITVHRAPHLGHFCQTQQPAQVAEQITDFLPMLRLPHSAEEMRTA